MSLTNLFREKFGSFISTIRQKLQADEDDVPPEAYDNPELFERVQRGDHQYSAHSDEEREQEQEHEEEGLRGRKGNQGRRVTIVEDVPSGRVGLEEFARRRLGNLKRTLSHADTRLSAAMDGEDGSVEGSPDQRMAKSRSMPDLKGLVKSPGSSPVPGSGTAGAGVPASSAAAAAAAASSVSPSTSAVLNAAPRRASISVLLRKPVRSPSRGSPPSGSSRLSPSSPSAATAQSQIARWPRSRTFSTPLDLESSEMQWSPADLPRASDLTPAKQGALTPQHQKSSRARAGPKRTVSTPHNYGRLSWLSAPVPGPQLGDSPSSSGTAGTPPERGRSHSFTRTLSSLSAENIVHLRLPKRLLSKSRTTSQPMFSVDPVTGEISFEEEDAHNLRRRFSILMDSAGAPPAAAAAAAAAASSAAPFPAASAPMAIHAGDGGSNFTNSDSLTMMGAVSPPPGFLTELVEEARTLKEQMGRRGGQDDYYEEEDEEDEEMMEEETEEEHEEQGDADHDPFGSFNHDYLDNLMFRAVAFEGEHQVVPSMPAAPVIPVMWEYDATLDSGCTAPEQREEIDFKAKKETILYLIFVCGVLEAHITWQDGEVPADRVAELYEWLSVYTTDLELTNTVILLGLIYVERVHTAHPYLLLSENDVRGMYVASLLAAAKFYDDEVFPNVVWAYRTKGRFDFVVFNRMEEDLLTLLDWRLNVDEDEFNFYACHAIQGDVGAADLVKARQLVSESI